MELSNLDGLNLAAYFVFRASPLYELVFGSDHQNTLEKEAERFAMAGKRYFDDNPEIQDQLREQIDVVDHQNEALYGELRSLAQELGNPEMVDKIDAIWQGRGMNSAVHSGSDSVVVDQGFAAPKALSYLRATANFRNELSDFLNDPEHKEFADAIFSRDSAGDIVASYLGPEGHQAFDAARDVWKDVSDGIFRNFGEEGPSGNNIELDSIGDREQEFIKNDIGVSKFSP